MSPLHCSKAALNPSLMMFVHPSVLMPCYSCLISADTERAVEILTRYQSTLQSPEEQELKDSIGKVSHIFQSELFQALLGKPLPCGPWAFAVSGLSWGPDPAQVPVTDRAGCILCKYLGACNAREQGCLSPPELGQGVPGVGAAFAGCLQCEQGSSVG